MHLMRIICTTLCLIGPVTVHAEEKTLSGTVKDTDGNPIDSAMLYLEDFSHIDEYTVYTNSQGVFTFPKIVAVRHSIKKNDLRRPVLNRNSILFTVTEPRTITKLELYDLSGKCVRRVVDETLSPREYSFSLDKLGLTPSAYIVSLELGSIHFSQKVIVRENGTLQVGGDRPVSDLTGKGSLARRKSEEPIDVLICSKDGYVRQQQDITSYDQTVDFVLLVEDAVPPVITFFPGEDTVQLHHNDSAAWSRWLNDEDVRINAVDDVDSLDVEIIPPTQTMMDTTRPGFVFVRYGARDKQHNVSEKDRLVVLYDSTVADDVPPVITVTPDTIVLHKGDLFPDTGITALDAVDSAISLTNWIDRSGLPVPDLPAETPGTFTRTYRVMDTHMNMATATRTVIVEE